MSLRKSHTVTPNDDVPVGYDTEYLHYLEG